MGGVLMSHNLKLAGFINPLWFNKVSSGVHEAVVVDGGHVDLQGCQLQIADPDAVSVAPGETVFVWLRRDFVFETAAERAAREVSLEERRIRDEEEDRRVAWERRQDAIAFNGRIHLPVTWIPGIKPVLSGLTERSWGDGAYRNTVVHILLQEDLVAGRIRRRKGDFLCTSHSGSNGRLGEVAPGSEVTSKITCKSCLRLAGRWTNWRRSDSDGERVRPIRGIGSDTDPER